MTILPLVSPALLPPDVSSEAARIVGADWRGHHAAGRECAARAIQRLTGTRPARALERGPAGEPLWPPDLTGSITHTGDFVWAAVGRRSQFRGLGVDAEGLISAERAVRVAATILRSDEHDVGGIDFSPPLRLTIVFSIKEAVFKCLYPLVGHRFDYSALRVTLLEGSGHFEAGLTTGLSSELVSGFPLPGRFEIGERRVYTAVALAAPPCAQKSPF